MNKTQKLKATVEDISFVTTFENLPEQLRSLGLFAILLLDKVNYTQTKQDKQS